MWEAPHSLPSPISCTGPVLCLVASGVTEEAERQQEPWPGLSWKRMVVRYILTICLATLAAANIEFKHHNNTELAAILQQVRDDLFILFLDPQKSEV